jgi:hypothetical protein
MNSGIFSSIAMARPPPPMTRASDTLYAMNCSKSLYGFPSARSIWWSDCFRYPVPSMRAIGGLRRCPRRDSGPVAVRLRPRSFTSTRSSGASSASGSARKFRYPRYAVRTTPAPTSAMRSAIIRASPA